MKRIVFLFVMLFSLVLGTSAQTVLDGKWYDNTFVGMSVGGNYSFADEPNGKFFKNLDPMVDINVGKYFTPIVGAQINYELGWAETPRTGFDHQNLSVDGLLNFSNLLWGYKGQSRPVELVGLLGMGWWHQFGMVDNSPSVRVGLQLNIKLGSSDAWSLNVEPVWTYLPDEDCQCIESSYISATVGLTYRFKNSHDTHNFVLAKLYDQSEVDLLNEQVNSLRAQNATLDKLVKGQEREINLLTIKNSELQKCCENKEIIKESHSVVGFTIGKSDISKVQLPALHNIAAELKKNPEAKVHIVGYADANTGSPELNLKLSEARAKAVQEVLKKYGVVENQMIVEWVGDTVQPYEDNDMNRVVLFVTK